MRKQSGRRGGHEGTTAASDSESKTQSGWKLVSNQNVKKCQEEEGQDTQRLLICG